MDNGNKTPAFVPHFWNGSGALTLALVLVSAGVLLYFFPFPWLQGGVHLGWFSGNDSVVTAEDVAEMENGKSYRDLCDVSWGCRYETISISSDSFTEWLMIQDRNDYNTKVVYGNYSGGVVMYEVSYANHAPIFTCEIKTGFSTNQECSYRLTQLPAYFRYRAYEGEPATIDVFVTHKDSDFAKKVGL